MSLITVIGYEASTKNLKLVPHALRVYETKEVYRGGSVRPKPKLGSWQLTKEVPCVASGDMFILSDFTLSPTDKKRGARLYYYSFVTAKGESITDELRKEEDSFILPSALGPSVHFTCLMLRNLVWRGLVDVNKVENCDCLGGE